MPVTLTLPQLVCAGDAADCLKLFPETAQQLFRAVLVQVDPKARALLEDTMSDAATLTGAEREPLPEASEDGSFDRGPLRALADWCDDNDEPEFGRACKFLIRHSGIRIHRNSWWSFHEETMPKRWSNIGTYSNSLLELFCKLAKEIDTRLKDLGV